MRYVIRLMDQPRDHRVAILGDALGAVALFAMAYVALHWPLFG